MSDKQELAPGWWILFAALCCIPVYAAIYGLIKLAFWVLA